MVRKYTHIFSFKNIPFNTKRLLLSLISAFFFSKNQHFLAKEVPSLKALVWELCYRYFSSVFSFCKISSYCFWKFKFSRLYVRNPVSWLLQICHKLKKITMSSQFADMTSLSIFWHQGSLNFADVSFFFFFDVVLCFLSSVVKWLVKVSCQYHHWFWSFGNLVL